MAIAVVQADDGGMGRGGERGDVGVQDEFWR